MKSWIINLFFLLTPVFIHGQVDTTYIKNLDHKLAIRPYISQNALLFNQKTEAGDEFEFKPNIAPSVGIGLSLNNTIVSFGYGYSFNFMRDKKLGKTKAFDFQLHHYGRMFVYDIYFQRYKGFHNDENDKITLYPDLRVHQYNVYGQYIFNHKKFSYRAAFDKSEKQLQSAGTFLIGAGVYKTKVRSDSSFVYKGANSYSSFQIGISGGYAYSWIIDRHWDVSLSASVGVNFGNKNFREFAQKKMDISPTTVPRLSAGYTRDSWSINFSTVWNITFDSWSKEEELIIASGTVQIAFIKRFETIPLIGKRGNRFIDRLGILKLF